MDGIAASHSALSQAGAVAAYSTSIAHKALDQQKLQGEAAVRLIEAATVPPPGPAGQGSLVNLYA